MFNIFKKKDKEEPKHRFIDFLIRSEYFEFTDRNRIEELKLKIQDSFDRFGTFTTTYDSNNKPNCKKIYFCDSETLFEGWGFKSQLEIMKEGLHKITNFENLQNQIPESYDYASNPEGSWSDAVVDFTTRINKYLSESGSKYLCYPAYDGNEGSTYLLNETQYLLLNTAIRDEHKRPLKLIEWIGKYNSKPSPEVIDSTDANNELKEGMYVKHVKFGVGQIIEINDRGVSNIRFEEGDKLIILKFARV